MKKLIASLSLVLVVALGVVGFSACKKFNVVGKWEFAKIEYIHADGSKEVVEANGSGGIGTFTFHKNGTGDLDGLDFKWKQKKNKIILTAEGVKLTFKIKGKYLVYESHYGSYDIAEYYAKIK